MVLHKSHIKITGNHNKLKKSFELSQRLDQYYEGTETHQG